MVGADSIESFELSRRRCGERGMLWELNRFWS
jgi:hypothetical protein